MKFANKVHEEVFQHVMTWTAELFHASAALRADGQGARVRFGSAYVDVTVGGVGATEAVVVAVAPVVTGSTLTPELTRHLLRKNCDARYGAFAVNDAGDIELRYSLVGSTCQKAELHAVLQYLMLAADLADDEIIARWGGVRARDLGA